MKTITMVFFASAILVFNNPVFAKSDSITENSILFEKVYLHIDRELYSPGDFIWFKSYLVSGINNTLIPGYKNIYVTLISDSGKVVDNKLLLSNNGVAHGDFKLGNVPDGTYIIRANTKYQQNFGVESFFQKKIVITRSKNSFELNTPKQDSLQFADVSFLPEGGNFVLNAINHFAFKAIDKKGKGVNIKGKIIDNEGNLVVEFRSIYKGMGKFMFMPQEGKSYVAYVDGHPDFSYKFDAPTPNGICLTILPDGNYYQVTLSRNLKISAPQNFVLTASHKGIELFNSEVVFNDFQHAQRLYKGLFPLGISKITLYDSKNAVVAERMIFVRNNNSATLQLSSSKTEYKTREKIELDISSLLSQSDTIVSGLSVAVVHEDYFSKSGNTQNIESYLLLDSELKGSIESPASCFVDEKNISANQKLDLVMQVNGWRSYYWNDLEKYRGIKLPDWADTGLSIKGKVTKEWGGKPVENGQVVMGPFSAGLIFEKTKTDKNGRFVFRNLYLKDSALVMINAKTQNKGKRVSIKLDSLLTFPSFILPKTLNNYCPDIAVPLKFYRTNFYRLQAERKYTMNEESILLDEVEIEGQRMDIGDGHFRLYGEADIVLNISDDDKDYFDILDYLEGRVPGVNVIGDRVSIRNSPKTPLLLIDGLEESWDKIREVSMGDIDKIEILKNAYSTAVFGSRGGDGVISVLTKMGKGEWENNFTRNIRGRITPRVRGFEQAHKFYSPKYTYLNINDPKPDYRPTLFWEPNADLKNGRVKLEFFSGDNLARYKIITEGISKKGKICVATGLLTVSSPRK